MGKHGPDESDLRALSLGELLQVWARSAAEMPVVVPALASMLTQNVVPNRELFCATIGGISSSSIRSGVVSRQISPRPYRAMKLIAYGQVTFIFALFVIGNDDHRAGMYRRNRLLDLGE